MKLVNKDEIIFEKTLRREKIKDLEFDCEGNLIHLGKVSTGCRSCFIRSNYTTFAIYVGTQCNADCPECYYDPQRNDRNSNNAVDTAQNFANLYETIINPNYDLKEISYNSRGEPLLYINALREAGCLVKRYQLSRGVKVFSHLYTNGILASKENLEILKDIEVTELRFHVSASNWSKNVIDNMYLANEMGFRVSVEESSLPEKSDALFRHLPIFNDIGVKHLNLVECQVTPYNFDYLNKRYPNGRYYRDFLWHFYDEGMVYDIMEEKIKNNYTFSMIDCNSSIECCRSINHQSNRPDFNSLDDLETNSMNAFTAFSHIQ